jgi:tetratricopeptide (TPR) repeat protein
MLIKHLVLAFAVCFIVTSIAQAKEKRSSPVRLMAGLGEVHHAVSTKNLQAQRFFDQGFKLVYGFNHDAARKSFQHAAELDPQLAMAWWGVALTLGPNYNLPVDLEREKAAYEAVQRAIALQENASEPERAYINALAFRYSNDPKADLHQLDVAYRDAMAKLVKNYPDDLDAATLYAESMMNLHPWQLWLRDGKPNEGTEEIVAMLESVLQRDPNHLGANHYYIHAVEASPHPERALASAARLEKLASAAGHLVHMPAHIYSRVGDHAASAHCNEVAAAADRKFITAERVQGVYPMMYYSHNLHFLAYANCMSGNFAKAKLAAAQLVANVQPHVKEMSMLEGFLPTPLFVLVAFERWSDILKLPAPDRSLIYTKANWHFARAMALGATGKTAEAQQESKMFFVDLAKLPRDASFDPLNSVASVARVQENLLAATIKQGDEEERRHGGEAGEAVIEALDHAIKAEDLLNYSEPPSWYPPIRPILGRVLLENGRPVDAEKIFRAALEKSPRYPRALVGLRDSLKAQNRIYEAGQIDQQLRDTQKATDSVSALRARATTRHQTSHK